MMISNIIRIIKSRIMGWAGHAARNVKQKRRIHGFGVET
jgi:hypothetical protein